ncbi:MAG: hypothetical protein M5U12_30205 [Verrucomicrobia bacterium]|nr:hypothetical protein [Verrucomicrobiota bacterium]
MRHRGQTQHAALAGGAQREVGRAGLGEACDVREGEPGAFLDGEVRAGDVGEARQVALGVGEAEFALGEGRQLADRHLARVAQGQVDVVEAGDVGQPHRSAPAGFEAGGAAGGVGEVAAEAGEVDDTAGVLGKHVEGAGEGGQLGQLDPTARVGEKLELVVVWDGGAGDVGEAQHASGAGGLQGEMPVSGLDELGYPGQRQLRAVLEGQVGLLDVGEAGQDVGGLVESQFGAREGAELGQRDDAGTPQGEVHPVQGGDVGDQDGPAIAGLRARRSRGWCFAAAPRTLAG